MEASLCKKSCLWVWFQKKSNAKEETFGNLNLSSMDDLQKFPIRYERSDIDSARNLSSVRQKRFGQQAATGIV